MEENNLLNPKTKGEEEQNPKQMKPKANSSVIWITIIVIIFGNTDFKTKSDKEKKSRMYW